MPADDKQTMTDLKQSEISSTLKEMRYAVAAIEDKKGESIRILDVRGKSSITDYVIIASGSSNPHIKAIKSALTDALKEVGVALSTEDREVGSGWIVVDAFDFVVHLQTQEVRDFYRLDQLWKDAMSIVIE